MVILTIRTEEGQIVKRSCHYNPLGETLKERYGYDWAELTDTDPIEDEDRTTFIANNDTALSEQLEMKSRVLDLMTSLSNHEHISDEHTSDEHISDEHISDELYTSSFLYIIFDPIINMYIVGVYTYLKPVLDNNNNTKYRYILLDIIYTPYIQIL